MIYATLNGIIIIGTTILLPTEQAITFLKAYGIGNLIMIGLTNIHLGIEKRAEKKNSAKVHGKA